MFTGIVEETGTVKNIVRGRESAVITIYAEKVLEDTNIGDSIAVNGVCLTVTAIDAKSFTADVMHETLNRSSLAHITSKSRVNLERAMRADGRFGGHIAAGHVDGTGKITRIMRDGAAVWYTIQADEKILRYIVEKGSVAIDGISLTVAGVSPGDFSVSIIPHTADNTILADRTEGSIVNIETDIIGKYVEKLMRPADNQAKSTITKELLSRCGF